MDIIRRTFHPIGQGAFYSERHTNFNIVNDCGSLTTGKTKEKVVSQSFSKDETIDILFISHFDSDHVNLINKLKDSVRRIRYVVMPLIDTDKECLARLCNIIYPNYPIGIIENPAEYFNESKVIYARTSENFERPFENNNPISLEELDGISEINSGWPIVSDQIPDWVFIPANYKFQERTQLVKDAFHKAGIDFYKAQTDINYLIEHTKEIKTIYRNVQGTINENSMVLYSGPKLHCDDYELIRQYPCYNRHCCYRCHRCHFFNDRPACVYTGDANLNKLKISQVFRSIWEHVGTIQVPHHGAINDFDFSLYGITSPYIMPVSFGTNNTYGHPSTKVMSYLLAEDCLPIQITENISTAYCQIIEKQ